MNESVVSKKIISKLRAKGYHAEKFWLNGNNGVPDIFITGKDTGGFFIETKKVEKLPTKDTSQALKHGFSKSQREKALKYSKNGTYVCGIVGIKMDTKIWIYKKVEVDNFVDSITKKELLSLPDFDFNDPIGMG